MFEPLPEAVREARRRWAELLRRIFEVDPLACPRCGQEMRVMAFITDPKVIDAILAHLERTAHAGPRSRAPPMRWRTTAASAPAEAHTDLPARSPLPRPALTQSIVRMPLSQAVGPHHGAVGDLIPLAGQLRGRAAYFAGTKANSYAERAARVVTEAHRGIHLEMEPASPAFDMMQRLHQVREQITRVRVVVLTNGLARDSGEVEHDVALEIAHDVWDLRRLFRVESSGLPYEPIEIDIERRMGRPLPCLPASNDGSDTDRRSGK